MSALTAGRGGDGGMPLALYVHFPWCVKKCPYCDFNSHAQVGEIDQPGYIAALIGDLEHDIAAYPSARKLTSIFMGGGTPSLFGGKAIAHLLDEIRARLPFDDDIEITLEANPGGIEHDDFAAYREAGVNRLSLGVQSFDDAQLEQLGRIHTAADAAHAIRAALDAGFANVNLDLMYGLPQQDRASALTDLETALDFAPAHLSLYQLTIEPNTWFHRYPPKLPDDERIVEMEQHLHALAAKHGYQQYEVSAHAQPNHQCKHNLNYWQFGDYLGIGAGAHGKITEHDNIKRYWKQRHPRRYLDSAGSEACIGDIKEITDREVLVEFLINALRLTDGFDHALIQQRTGQDVDEVLGLLADAIERGLVINNGEKIKCSPHGYRFLDEILQGVLPESVA